MIVRSLRSALTLAVLLVSPAAFAAGHYTVSVRLAHRGEAFAAPTMVVEAGKPAAVATSGSDAYSLAVTVVPRPDGKLRVSSTVQSAHGRMAPVLVVQPGEPATVSVGDLSLALVVARDGR